MKIRATVENSKGHHHVTLCTNEQAHSIQIPPKPSGFGSSANGGELLFLALATCYCNDIYREAARERLQIDQVEVTVEGQFGGVGDPATNVTYRAKVTSPENEADIRRLMEHTDSVAEVQNTLRTLTPIQLREVEVVRSVRQEG